MQKLGAKEKGWRGKCKITHWAELENKKLQSYYIQKGWKNMIKWTNSLHTRWKTWKRESKHTEFIKQQWKQIKATAWNDLSHGVWSARWMHENLEEEGREKKRRKETESVIMPICLTFLSYQLVRTICLLPARSDSGFSFFLWTASVLRHSLKKKILKSVFTCPIIASYLFKTPIFRCTLQSKKNALCAGGVFVSPSACLWKPVKSENFKWRLLDCCRCRTEGNIKTDLREIQWKHYEVWLITRTSL
jgi:hypothetical protein